MQQRIEYARRQALEARAKAGECIDTKARAEWIKAARMWEVLIEQYELLRRIGETTATLGDSTTEAPDVPAS